MTLWGISERMMAMDDAAWRRHANPVSGWSRITILPLISVAIWSRVWLGGWCLVPVTMVVIWAWLNPRLFKPPPSDAAWMTRAVLGERLLLADQGSMVPQHHRRAAKFLAITSGVGSLLIAFALWKLSLEILASGLILAMGSKLWFLDRMVWLFEDNQSFQCDDQT